MPLGTAIRRVTPHVLMAPLLEPFAFSQAWYRERGAMLVEIETEDGAVGRGEAFGPPALTAPVVARFAPMLEMDRSPHPVRDALTPPVPLQGGTVAIPEAPGLGVAPDPDALAYFRA